MPRKPKTTPRELTDLAWTYIDDGALFTGVARLREAADAIEDIAIEQRAKLRKLHRKADHATFDKEAIEYAYKNPRDILRDGVEILEAVLTDREAANGEKDEIFRDYVKRVKIAAKVKP